MKHHLKLGTAVMAIIMATFPSQARKKDAASFPIDPIAATMISDPANKMSHAPSTVITEDGTVYVIYYRNLYKGIETPENNTSEIILDKFPLKSWKNPKITRTHILSNGESVGDFTQNTMSPYDPQINMVNGRIVCTIRGYENDEYSLFASYVDTGSGTLENKAFRCTLSWKGQDGTTVTVPLTTSGLRQFYQSLGIDTEEAFSREKIGKHNPYIDKRYVRRGDWYYTALGCWCFRHAVPAIIRTKDGINFEVAFTCPQYTLGAAEVTFEIADGSFYILARTARPEKGRGTYLSRYSMDGECMYGPRRIGDVESLPSIFAHNGKVYAIRNIHPNYLLPNGKRVSRSRIRISEVAQDLQLLRSWEIASPNSLQYYNVAGHKGRLYMTFVESRDKKPGKDWKGNICFTELNL